MIGTAGLKNLRVDCIVGIHAHERAAKQAVMADIEFDYDFGAAAASEAIGDAADYSQVATWFTEMAEQRGFQLIETMAEHAVAMLLERLPAVRTVRLEIRKPAAVPSAACAFVRLERTRA